MRWQPDPVFIAKSMMKKHPKIERKNLDTIPGRYPKRLHNKLYAKAMKVVNRNKAWDITVEIGNIEFFIKKSVAGSN